MKIIDDERLVLNELKKFINKYLQMNLVNFNLDTEVILEIDQNGTPIKVYSKTLAIEWHTLDYENRVKLKQLEMSVSELLEFIKDYENLVYRWFN